MSPHTINSKEFKIYRHFSLLFLIYDQITEQLIFVLLISAPYFILKLR